MAAYQLDLEMEFYFIHLQNVHFFYLEMSCLFLVDSFNESMSSTH